jgi:hypothetical protein
MKVSGPYRVGVTILRLSPVTVGQREKFQRLRVVEKGRYGFD